MSEVVGKRFNKQYPCNGGNHSESPIRAPCIKKEGKCNNECYSQGINTRRPSKVLVKLFPCLCFHVLICQVHKKVILIQIRIKANYLKCPKR